MVLSVFLCSKCCSLPEAFSHFSLVLLQRRPENIRKDLTKFKRFKNSKLVLFCLIDSRLTGAINLPKGFHAPILLAQPKDGVLGKAVNCFC